MAKAKVHCSKDQFQLRIERAPRSVEDLLGWLQFVEDEYRSMAHGLGAMVMMSLMESEVELLAGKRYERGTEVDRNGRQTGYVTLAGQKVRVRHTRLKRKNGGDVVPETYRRFQDDSPRSKEVFRHLLAGVSTRNYKDAVTTVADGYGISKSVVSREMVEATGEEIRRLMERPLGAFDLRVLLVDGVRIVGTVFVVAVGIDAGGRKQVLGFREGATENAVVTTELLESLVSRGLKTDHPILAVLDGAKALSNAVKNIWDRWAVIQRCELHKRRNVTSHLPKKYQREVDRMLAAAYAMNSYDDARAAIEQILHYLDRINDSAAESLREGLEETLTVHRLGLPPTLRKSLMSTNIIDSMFSMTRSTWRNVKRWKDSHMKHRWVATALLAAEKRFHRVLGYRSLGLLDAAVKAEVARQFGNRQAAA